jgi:AcrR family transcriptional regulator
MGLREMKKERSREAILRAARKLFFSLGYDGTTVEAIAEEAQVAVGTVYNYFQSKSGLILEITSMDVQNELEENFRVLPSESGLDTLHRFIDGSLAVLGEYPREFLREVFREAFSTKTRDLGEGLMRQDISMVEKLSGILGELAGSGRLRSDLDTWQAAMVIYGILLTSVIVYVSDPGRTAEQIMRSVDDMLQTVYEGLEPKGDDR